MQFAYFVMDSKYDIRKTAYIASI